MFCILSQLNPAHNFGSHSSNIQPTAVYCLGNVHLKYPFSSVTHTNTPTPSPPHTHTHTHIYIYIHFFYNYLHFSATCYFLVSNILLWDDSGFLGYNAVSLGNRLPADVAPFSRRTVLSATMLRKFRISNSSVAIRILRRRALISRNVKVKWNLFRELPPTLLQSERFFVKNLRQLHQLINSQINSFGNFFPRKSAQTL